MGGGAAAVTRAGLNYSAIDKGAADCTREAIGTLQIPDPAGI